ncbi:MAG: bifunctional 5,10-methylenetetrahydrofolate dehydrogenase/5,10-methenyltetrahydrofolate cyclohydrolase [Acidobacteriota bacterium]
MTKILGGKEIAEQIRAELAAGVAELRGRGGRVPGLTAVFVGEDSASEVYVASKTRGCEEVGMIGRTLRLPATITADAMRHTVNDLNADDTVDGILIQLPLPKGLPERELLDLVDPRKDVDGFHPENVGRLWLDQPGFVSATPAGVIELLRRNDVPMVGQHAVVIGRSNIVGKPMAGLLLREHCTVTLCHSRTRDLAAITRQADILIAAIGRPGFVGPQHVKEGAVVIDVGMNRVADREIAHRLFGESSSKRKTFETRGSVLTGDVDYERVSPIASAITPVPGGVGLLTVAMVLANTLQAARRRQGL